jgi:hypothetical protein
MSQCKVGVELLDSKASPREGETPGYPGCGVSPVVPRVPAEHALARDAMARAATRDRRRDP